VIALIMLIVAAAIVVLPALGQLLREIMSLFARLMAVALIIVLAMILTIILLLAISTHGWLI
jgi:hypothetical protein